MSICKVCIKYYSCDSPWKDDVVICNEYSYVIKENGFYIKKHPHHGHKEVIGPHYSGEVVEEQNEPNFA